MIRLDDEIVKIWDNMVDYGIATENELSLISSINGYSIETLNSVLYARTGFRDWEQFASQ